jgi:hypothetical protein
MDMNNFFFDNLSDLSLANLVKLSDQAVRNGATEEIAALTESLARLALDAKTADKGKKAMVYLANSCDIADDERGTKEGSLRRAFAQGVGRIDIKEAQPLYLFLTSAEIGRTRKFVVAQIAQTAKTMKFDRRGKARLLALAAAKTPQEDPDYAGLVKEFFIASDDAFSSPSSQEFRNSFFRTVLAIADKTKENDFGVILSKNISEPSLLPAPKPTITPKKRERRGGAVTHGSPQKNDDGTYPMAGRLTSPMP